MQVAHHFGDNPAPHFVSVSNSRSLKIHAITNPLSDPTLVSTGVAVPCFAGPSAGAPNVGGTLSVVDRRIFNVQWRDGELYAAHTIRAGGRNNARWYHLRTNGWPAGQAVEYLEGGKLNRGIGVHTFFPAIAANKYGSVAVVLGSCTAETTPDVEATGRLASDPPGEMSDLNADGQVDLADLTILLANHGKTNVLYDDGDFSGDGTIDLVDLTVMLQNYGQACP